MMETSELMDLRREFRRTRDELEQTRASLAAAVKAKEEAEEAYTRMFDREVEVAAKAERLEVERDSLRARLEQERTLRECAEGLLACEHNDVLSLRAQLAEVRGRAEEKTKALERARELLEKMQAEVEDWHHTEYCSRSSECDEAEACEGEDCELAKPHPACDYCGHEGCCECECGKAPMLEMIAKVLAALSSPASEGVVTTREQIDAVQPPATAEEANEIIRSAGVDPGEFMERAREHVRKVRGSGVEREDGPSLCEELGDLITEAGLKLVIKPPTPTDGGGKR